MEIVILEDMVASWNTVWVRIANTAGADAIKVGDEFKENGALEEFQVESVSPSPVPGASRIRLLRAHHSTKPEVHKVGAVLAQTNETWPGRNAFEQERALVIAAEATFDDSERMIAALADIPDTIVAGGTEYANPAKRGRGRPPGAKNKPKNPLVPAWPSV